MPVSSAGWGRQSYTARKPFEIAMQGMLSGQCFSNRLDNLDDLARPSRNGLTI